MATERLSMRQTREILRQKWGLGRTHREVAQSLRISTSAVGTTVLRARAAGLDWAQVDALSDDVLHARVYGPPTPPTHHRAVPDCAYLHAERRRPGVTLELLHLEYLEQHPDGYRYTQFCECYRRWLGRRGLSMRQVHRAGAKLFVDYAGKKPTIIDATTGEVIAVELLSPCSTPRTTPTPKPRARSRSRTGSRATSARSSSLAASPRPSCPINSRAVSSSRAATSRACSGRTTTSPSTTAPSSCPRARRNRGTKRKSKSRSRSPNGGSSLGSGTRPSSPSPPSTPASPSSSRI